MPASACTFSAAKMMLSSVDAAFATCEICGCAILAWACSSSARSPVRVDSSAAISLFVMVSVACKSFDLAVSWARRFSARLIAPEISSRRVEGGFWSRICFLMASASCESYLALSSMPAFCRESRASTMPVKRCLSTCTSGTTGDGTAEATAAAGVEAVVAQLDAAAAAEG